MPKNMTVFVYGSLLKGYHNHDYHLTEAKFLGKAVSMRPAYQMYSAGGFPVLKETNGEGKKVYGELYEVDAEQFANLDRLEGEGFMYQREEHLFQTLDKNKKDVLAWVYLGVPSAWDYDEMPEVATVASVGSEKAWHWRGY